jgi:CRP/FNR family transcriptional regulator, anaerobic regulatory protein
MLEAAVARSPITITLRPTATSRTRVVLRDVNRNQRLCSNCSVRDQCLSEGLDSVMASRVDELVSTRIRLSKGDALYRTGTPFTALYAIHSGSLKSVLLAEDGRDQVMGYHMPGELVGLDGIGNDLYQCQTNALEDSEVCVMPFDRIERFGRDNTAFQHNVHRYLSREIKRQATVMLSLGTMRAEQRLAAFLLDLSKRYDARGYSSREFVLRMTREEIGSYLGLQLETISRLMARFQREGLIQFQGRVVKLLDRRALKQLVGQSA